MLNNYNQPAELDGAKWIGPSESCSSPIISRRFEVSGKTDARLYITGLGYFEVKINGKAVTEDRFIPVASNYEPRDLTSFSYPIYDTLTCRIYYYSYDISSFIQQGTNLLEIQLGDGWYRQRERVCEGPLGYGETLKTIYRIDLGKISICSDGSESWQSSRILYNSLYIGEIQDARHRPEEPKPVIILSDAESILAEAMGTPDRVIRKITPELLTEVNGRKIYDVGENISGIVRVRSNAKSGEQITLRFAEVLNDDNTLNFRSTGSDYVCPSGRNQIMTDVFICDGNECVFEPKFTWHGFRYFDIEGEFDTAEVLVIHSNCEVTSSFESSSEGLNFLYEAFIRTQLNNMHGSIPSDCPHRERLGYTGDGQICCRAVMTLLDSKEFYRKWIVDLLDCQDVKNGHVQHTAPFMGGGGGPGGWGCAIVIVPYEYYRQFGETDILQQCYEPMCRWIKYLTSRLENGLVTHEEERGWCLGDWCTLEKCVIPEPFVNTYYFIKILRIVCEIAAVIGEEQDIEGFRKLDEDLCQALTDNFRGEDGHFCQGIQGADAYAVDIGLGDSKLAGELAEKYQRQGYFDTGFLGTSILLDVLFKHDFTDTAYNLLNSEKEGSFLYMKRQGATTIWETWNDTNVSHNHPMFGSGTHHLLSSVLGITQAEDSAGYEKPVIAPHVPKTLRKAGGSVSTPKGKISVSFEQNEQSVIFSIQLPENMKAVFRYKGKILELEGGSCSVECECE